MCVCLSTLISSPSCPEQKACEWALPVSARFSVCSVERGLLLRARERSDNEKKLFRGHKLSVIAFLPFFVCMYVCMYVWYLFMYRQRWSPLWLLRQRVVIRCVWISSSLSGRSWQRRDLRRYGPTCLSLRGRRMRRRTHLIGHKRELIPLPSLLSQLSLLVLPLLQNQFYHSSPPYLLPPPTTTTTTTTTTTIYILVFRYQFHGFCHVFL